MRKKGFLCFHGSFQKALFLLPAASLSALQVPPNVLLSSVYISELARLEARAGASQANPAPGPQLRGPLTALAERPSSQIPTAGKEGVARYVSQLGDQL